jgi:arsenate reductase
MAKIRVLFLCSGNSARSQMAEAFLRQHAGDRFEVYSAGLEPRPINPFTFRVMEERGISMAGHHAKDIAQFVGQVHFGYLITVCDRAAEACPIFPGMGARLHWPFDDPAAFVGSEEETLAVFRTVRDQIEARLLEWIKTI